VFESGRLNEKRLLRLIRDLRDGDNEIVTHLASSRRGAAGSRLEVQWEQELAAVLSPRVRDAIAARGIELVNYSSSPSAAGPVASTRRRWGGWPTAVRAT